MEEFNRIKESAENNLKTIYRRRTDKTGQKMEEPWLNENIREGMKKRKHYNRLTRSAKTIEEKKERNYSTLNKRKKYNMK